MCSSRCVRSTRYYAQLPTVQIARLTGDARPSPDVGCLRLGALVVAWDLHERDIFPALGGVRNTVLYEPSSRHIQILNPRSSTVFQFPISILASRHATHSTVGYLLIPSGTYCSVEYLWEVPLETALGVASRHPPKFRLSSVRCSIVFGVYRTV
jgi:hypothetical protein